MLAEGSLAMCYRDMHGLVFSLYPIIVCYTLDSHLLYAFAILVLWCDSPVYNSPPLSL